LRADDIDLDRHVVRVERSVYRGRLGPPKTRSSRRYVALSGLATRLVREQLVGRAPNQLDLVWPGDAGGHVAVKHWMRKVFRPAVLHAGLTPFRFHDLRHTYVALLIAAGAHPKWLQAQLGHSSISQTLDRYGHLFPDASEPFMQRLDDLTASKQTVGSAWDSPR
jgi:integrase